jgi:hypothetical protein
MPSRRIFLIAPLLISTILIIWAYSVAGPPQFGATGLLVSGQDPTGSLIEKPYIPSSQIQDMAYDRLEKSISENKTALIFFYDNSCDTCIAQIAEIEALLEHLEKNSPDIFKNFTYYEYDFNLGLREKFNVTQDHTLILIKEGKEVLRTREAMTKDELLGKIV